MEGLQSLGLGGWLGPNPEKGITVSALFPVAAFVVASAVGFTGRFITPHYFLGECPRPWPLIFAQDCRGRNHLLLGQRMADSSYFFLVNNDTHACQGHRTAG